MRHTIRLIPWFYIGLHLICFPVLCVAVKFWINKVELESICFDQMLISHPGSKVILIFIRKFLVSEKGDASAISWSTIYTLQQSWRKLYIVQKLEQVKKRPAALYIYIRVYIYYYYIYIKG